MNKIPPFNPGDRVIYIPKVNPEQKIQNDVIYTIGTIWYCCNGTPWRLTLLETNYDGICGTCGKSAPGYAARNFRKIDDIISGADMLIKELEAPVGEPVYM